MNFAAVKRGVDTYCRDTSALKTRIGFMSVDVRRTTEVRGDVGRR